MDFDLVDKASAIALKSISAGEPIAPAFGRICELVLPELPEAVASVVEKLALSEDVEALTEQLRALLAEEPPSAAVNGLWFGIAEMVWGEDEDDEPADDATPEFTLYIAGSTEFDPENEDWPCGPVWWPESRYFVVPSFKDLSDLSATMESDDAWLVAAGLIEPLSILLIGEVCRAIEPATLLGGAPWRGVGSGFDGGDLRDIGVVTHEGFASPALLPKKGPAKKPAAPKSAARAAKAKLGKTKPAKAKSTKKTSKKAGMSKAGAKRATAKKAAKKGSTTRAAKKNSVKKKAAKKKSSSRPAKRATLKRRR
jgi:hypothetical protein